MKPDYHFPTELLSEAHKQFGLCREDSAQFSKQLFHAVPPTRRSLGFSLPRHTSFYSVSPVAVAVYGLEAWLVTLEMLDAMSWYANSWKDYQNILATPWNQGVYVGLRSWNSSPDLNFKVCVLCLVAFLRGNIHTVASSESRFSGVQNLAQDLLVPTVHQGFSACEALSQGWWCSSEGSHLTVMISVMFENVCSGENVWGVRGEKKAKRNNKKLCTMPAAIREWRFIFRASSLETLLPIISSV